MKGKRCFEKKSKEQNSSSNEEVGLEIRIDL